MSVKVADTIVSMNPDEFPAVMGESVNLVKSDSTEKSLQAMYEDGELGGDGTVQFVGTTAQWDALSDTEKEKYDGKEVIITDDTPDKESDLLEIKTMTTEAYDALSEEEKNNDKVIYNIPDLSSVVGPAKILSGKKLATFGDSITWYDGNPYNWGKEEGVIAKGYQEYLIKCLGLSVTNYGESGYTMPLIYNKLKTLNLSGFNYITITGGCNDERHNVSVGTVKNIGSSYDATTYIGALQASIDYCIQQNPEVKIILMTPIKGWVYPEQGWAYEGHPTDACYELSQNYVNAMKEVGKKYALPVCDWNNECGINLATRSIYINDPEPEDGNEYYSLHPSTKGYIRMAECLIPYFKHSVL